MCSLPKQTIVLMKRCVHLFMAVISTHVWQVPLSLDQLPPRYRLTDSSSRPQIAEESNKKILI